MILFAIKNTSKYHDTDVKIVKTWNAYIFLQEIF